MNLIKQIKFLKTMPKTNLILSGLVLFSFFLASNSIIAQCPTGDCSAQTVQINFESLSKCDRGSTNFRTDFDKDKCETNNSAKTNCVKYVITRSSTTSAQSFSANIGQGTSCNGDIDAAYSQIGGVCTNLNKSGSQQSVSLTFPVGVSQIILFVCKESSGQTNLCGCDATPTPPTCTPSVTCPADATFECDDDAGIKAWLASVQATTCGGTLTHDFDRNKFTECNKTGMQKITFTLTVPNNDEEEDEEDGEDDENDDSKLSSSNSSNDDEEDNGDDEDGEEEGGTKTITCSAKLTIVDTKKPVFDGKLNDITIECGDPIPALPELKAKDACGDVTYSAISGVSIGICPIKEVQSRCLIATDACKNETRICQLITIKDTKGPDFSNVPANATVCGENNIPSLGSPTAFDKCDNARVTVEYKGETKGTTSCATAYTLTRTWSAKDACGNISTATQVITVEKTPVGGTAKADKKELCKVYNEKVNLWVEGNTGDVLKWQIDEDCNGNWVDIPNSKSNSIWVSPPAPENEKDCCLRYRAIVGCNIACTPVPSAPVQITVDVPAKGGKVVYNNYTSKTLCPGQCVDLELKGYVGRIVTWQMTDATSPVWKDIPNTAGLTKLNVCYPSKTTYYRVLICATCGVCAPPYFTAYSASFKLSPASMCGMWNDPTALVSNNEMTLAKVYPSPAKNNITIEADGLTEGVAQFEVLDITGKVVHQEKQPVNNGFNEINMNISELSNGLYILRITDIKGQKASVKISKM